jgi:redox-sensitive bicupin YhaK (pirin superfamily)
VPVGDLAPDSTLAPARLDTHLAVAHSCARGLDIGPHPHTGLQTVTWLVAGEVLHRDSLGSEQVIRAGQLNLMTAGHGVTHSEEATGRYRGDLHGVQLWVAQPEATRHGPAAVDAALEPGTGAWPLRPRFEYALVVLDGEALVGAQVVRPGQLAYLGQGREALALSARDPTRVLLLLGGEPFPEPILMWWNFVARTREEIDTAHRQWEAADPRFGRLSSPLARIPAPPPFWARPA